MLQIIDALQETERNGVSDNCEIKSNSRRSWTVPILIFFLFALIFGQSNLSQSAELPIDLKNRAEAETKFKRDILGNFIRSAENQVLSLAGSEFTHQFANEYHVSLRAPLTALFHAVATANIDYMQVRFLDMYGRERVRIDRPRNDSMPIIVSGHDMQDKSGKSYFQGTKTIPDRELWHSKFNLNMERGEIEKPIRPTFRVSTPVYFKGRFRGIVVINLAMDRILDLLRQSADFDVFLIDRDGKFLLHSDPKHSWSRYLTGRADYVAPPRGSGKHYSQSLEDLFENGEGIRLVLQSTEGALSPSTVVELTEEEERWIEHNRVKVGIEEWPPVVFTTKEGKVGGIAGSYIELLAQRTGLQFEFISDAWEPLLNGLRNRTIDLLPDAYYTEERATFGRFSKPRVLQSPSYAAFNPQYK